MIKQHKGFHELRTNEIFHYSVGTDLVDRPLGLTDSQKITNEKWLSHRCVVPRSTAQCSAAEERAAPAAQLGTMAAAAPARGQRWR